MSASPVQLSLAMIVRNEARCLARCLESIRAAVDEVVVADTGSSDESREIARRFGAKVVSFGWINDFAAARNFALEQARGEWLLVLDADEYASDTLRKEIRDFIGGPPRIGRLKIVSDFRLHGQTLRSSTHVARLFPRGARFEGRIHEQVRSPLPRENLRGELWHDGYLETRKTERNIGLLQAELAREPGSAYLQFQLALEFTSLGRTADAFACLEKARVLMRPSDPFAPNVIVDFLYAAMELKEFAAGLGVIRAAENRLADFPDFHHVCGLFYMRYVGSDPARHLAEMPKIEASFRRCLAVGETDKYKSVQGTGSFLASYHLGVFHHALGDDARARPYLAAAAKDGYAPAVALLGNLKPPIP